MASIRLEGLSFEVSLCTKTVYNMIARGDFLNLTNDVLPEKRRRKKRKHRKVRQVSLNNLKGRSIEERPAAVDERKESGHWEMDLVVGSGTSCLLVLTERVSRLEMLMKLPNKRQESVIKALDRLEKRYGKKFADRFKSLTMDNGSEFLDSEGIEASCLRPGMKRTTCYYAHPYSAWERGSNENANKLIRRFIPKGIDIGKLNNQAIKRIEHCEQLSRACLVTGQPSGLPGAEVNKRTWCGQLKLQSIDQRNTAHALPPRSAVCLIA